MILRRKAELLAADGTTALPVVGSLSLGAGRSGSGGAPGVQPCSPSPAAQCPGDWDVFLDTGAAARTPKLRHHRQLRPWSLRLWPSGGRGSVERETQNSTDTDPRQKVGLEGLGGTKEQTPPVLEAGISAGT